jgi:hypothetical protein
MGLRSVITITTAPPGGGKSYVRCARYLVDEYLVETDGRVITNFPIGLVPPHHPFPPAFEGERFIDRIAAAVAKKKKCSPEQVADRIELIPDHVLKTWADQESGPWDWFAEADIDGAHIAIDEIHVYCGRFSKRPIKDKWAKWLGEIRHRGATVELITQHEDKIARELLVDIGAKLQVVKKDDEREPFFGILMGDWYELRAKFLTGRYTSCVAEIESRDVAGEWKQNRVRRWWMDPDYFRFYDSHNAPHSGNGAGASSQKKEFQRRSWYGLLLWFLLRNFEPLFLRGLGVAAIVWACSFGGVQWGIQSFMAWTKSFAMKNGGAKLEAMAAPAPSPAPVEPARPAPRVASPAQTADGKRAVERAFVEIERQREAFQIGLMTDREVTFRGGYTYALGEEIDVGPYRGKIVERIEWTKRAVRLSDGTWLRMAVNLDAGRDDRMQIPNLGPAPLARGSGTADVR